MAIVKRKLNSLPPLRNAATVSLVCFAMSFFVLSLMQVFSLFAPPPQKLMPAMVWLTVPITTLILVFLAAWLACLLFNLVARITGGVEYHYEQTDA